mgnify:CR=1 FL=1
METKYNKSTDINLLIPYINNSRTHSDAQIAQVAASITEFGFTNPILIDDDSSIIAGHGRLLAARKLGLKKVPTITLSGITEAQKKAYVIADNQLALNSGWDLDQLRVEIEGLKELDFDTDLLGFDDDFMSAMFVEGSDFPDLESGEKEPFQQKTFTLHDEQAGIVDDAISKARTDPLCDTGLNENSNGNALALICEAYIK